MAKRIALVNQKGGVGKTTTCVNLASALRKLGQRVLVCDFDPQANTTSGFGIEKQSANPSIYEVIIDSVPTKKAIHRTPYCDVIPVNKSLAGAGIEMISLPDREHLLAQALAQVADDYDFLFIDCPPSLELLTLNGICAADSVLIPVQCEYYALEGLSDLMGTLRIVKRSLCPHIEIEGVLLTMYDARTHLSLQVAEEIKRFFPGKVYATAIPRTVRLAEAPSHGMPVDAYDPYNRGTEAYAALAREFAEKNGLTLEKEG